MLASAYDRQISPLEPFHDLQQSPHDTLSCQGLFFGKIGSFWQVRKIITHL